METASCALVLWLDATLPPTNFRVSMRMMPARIAAIMAATMMPTMILTMLMIPTQMGEKQERQEMNATTDSIISLMETASPALVLRLDATPPPTSFRESMRTMLARTAVIMAATVMPTLIWTMLMIPTLMREKQEHQVMNAALDSITLSMETASPALVLWLDATPPPINFREFMRMMLAKTAAIMPAKTTSKLHILQNVYTPETSQHAT
jgi:hypothetical protein